MQVRLHRTESDRCRCGYTERKVKSCTSTLQTVAAAACRSTLQSLHRFCAHAWLHGELWQAGARKRELQPKLQGLAALGGEQPPRENIRSSGTQS
jgi:hypothetical protein